MYETVRNPYYKQPRIGEPNLTAPVRNRDAEILKAYDRIAMSIKAMLGKLASREQQKHVEFAHPWQLSDHSVTKEFICRFCSIQLYLKRDEYLIELFISPESCNNGTGINSTALLRLAFRHTSDEITDLFIENCLKITITDNAAAYFLQKEEQYEDTMQKAYREWDLNKKQGL